MLKLNSTMLLTDFSTVLQFIYSEQQQNNGLLQAWRVHKWLPYRRFDDSFFFTASALWVLQEMAPCLPATDRQLIKKITEAARPAFDCFSNRKGLPSYNFWRSHAADGHKTDKPFPNGLLLQHLYALRLPDDVDCTALAMLTIPHSSQNEQWFYDELQMAAHKREKKYCFNTERESLAAYPVWLGNRMDKELDICVLCNLLCWLHKKSFATNRFTQESILFIEKVIAGGLWLKKPVAVAPYYPDSCVVAYHLARYCHLTNYMSEQTKAILQDQLEKLTPNRSLTRHAMLQTARQRLNARPVERPANIADDTNQFSFFTAGMLNAFKGLKAVSRWPVTHVHYVCPAFNKVLQAEAWLPIQ